MPFEFISCESQCISQLSAEQQTLLLIMAAAAIAFPPLSPFMLIEVQMGKNWMPALYIMVFFPSIRWVRPNIRTLIHLLLSSVSYPR